jgi:hypothetical protein
MGTNLKKHEAAVDAYLAKLKAFLMTPDHGDGSWPDIQPDELSTGRDLMVELLDLKWGEDCDGDAPVILRMWNRRTHRMVCDWAFTSNGPRDEEPLAATEARLIANLSTVQGALASASEALRLNYTEQADLYNRKQRQQAAFTVVQVTYVPNAEWDSAHKGETPVSLHADSEAANTFIQSLQTARRGTPLTVRRQVALYAVPPYGENPADGFSEYRKRVEAAFGKVLPQFTAVRPLNLSFGKP